MSLGLWDFAAAAAWEQEQPADSDSDSDEEGEPDVPLEPEPEPAASSALAAARREAELWRRSLEEPGAVRREQRRQQEREQAARERQEMTPYERLQQRMRDAATAREAARAREESLIKGEERRAARAASMDAMYSAAAQGDRAAEEGRSRERFFATLSKPKPKAARARRQPARRGRGRGALSSSSSSSGSSSSSEDEGEEPTRGGAGARGKSSWARHRAMLRKRGGQAQTHLRLLKAEGEMHRSPPVEECDSAVHAKAQLMSQSEDQGAQGWGWGEAEGEAAADTPTQATAWGSWGAGGSDETPAATLACWGAASAEDLRQGDEDEEEVGGRSRPTRQWNASTAIVSASEKHSLPAAEEGKKRAAAAEDGKEKRDERPKTSVRRSLSTPEVGLRGNRRTGSAPAVAERRKAQLAIVDGPATRGPVDVKHADADAPKPTAKDAQVQRPHTAAGSRGVSRLASAPARAERAPHPYTRPGSSALPLVRTVDQPAGYTGSSSGGDGTKSRGAVARRNIEQASRADKFFRAGSKQFGLRPMSLPAGTQAGEHGSRRHGARAGRASRAPQRVAATRPLGVVATACQAQRY